MEALYLLVPLSIAIVFAAIWAFFWMSDNGQFDDMEGPGLRILEDRDDDPSPRSRDGRPAHRTDDPDADRLANVAADSWGDASHDGNDAGGDAFNLPADPD